MYEAALSRENPGCIVFLLDRSDSMGRGWRGDRETMAEGAAAALNKILRDLTLKSTRRPGLIDYFFDIGIFGYGIRPFCGGEGVESAFGGRLQGQSLVPLPALQANPLIVQRVSSTDPAGPTIQQPVWVKPAHGYRTPTCEAIAVAGGYVSDWAGAHPDSFPPVIINITDGFVTDSPYEGADLHQWANRLTSIETNDGPALLFNIFLSPTGENGMLFPASDYGLPAPGPELFRISSVLPVPMIINASRNGIAVPAGARGFGFNADLPLLDTFMEITLRAFAEIGARGMSSTEVPERRWWQADEDVSSQRTATGAPQQSYEWWASPRATSRPRPCAASATLGAPNRPPAAARAAGALAAGVLAVGARAAEALAASRSTLSNKHGNQDLHAGALDDPVSRAVRASMRPGLLAFNPPTEMIQGRRERVEVGIARSPELREALATGLRGRGEVQLESIDTSARMGVELKGPSFEIVSFSELEQLVAPTARWEFDVCPYRAGLQTLTLCVSLRIEPGRSAKAASGRIAIPILEREIRIRVDVGYGARRFIANNWQWLIATILGLGSALAAWVTLIH